MSACTCPCPECGSIDLDAYRDQIGALVDEIRELTRQRDHARDLAVRSGIFEVRDCDCVFTRHDSDLCGALSEQEMQAAGQVTDHNVGHEPGETCADCGPIP